MSSTIDATKQSSSGKKIIRKVKKSEVPEVAAEPAVVEPEVSSSSQSVESSRTKKPRKKQVSDPVPEAPTEEPTVESTTDALENVSLNDMFDSHLAELENQCKDLKKAITKIRDMKKMYRRQERENNKKRRGRKGKKDPNRKPNGFAKPGPVSEELLHFLGKEKGTEVARTIATKDIIAYIKAKELQKPENKKAISPDEALRALVGDIDNLTFFNLQTHLSKHFPKKKSKSVEQPEQEIAVAAA